MDDAVTGCRTNGSDVATLHSSPVHESPAYKIGISNGIGDLYLMVRKSSRLLHTLYTQEHITARHYQPPH